MGASSSSNGGGASGAGGAGAGGARIGPDRRRDASSQAETLPASNGAHDDSIPGHPLTLGTDAGAVAVAAGPELLPGTRVGEYRIEGKLGEGGMGRVFAAVHPVIGKQAAIKVLRRELCANPDVVARFVQEARSVNQIRHPNIVDIFGFGDLGDGRSYFIMERLEGESLHARLRRGPMPLAETCRILDEIAIALAAAHDERIVHRDLKPDNVFLCAVRGERPRIKLLDFGIAKLLDDDVHRIERTRTGSMMGTPQYVAPEQARGYDVGPAADVYSLGVMAFEMVTGRPPFVADNAMDMIAKHLNDPPPSPAAIAPGVPPALTALILAMLAKDPADRPTLAAVRPALGEIGTAAAGMLPAEAQVAATIPEAELPRTLRARRRTRGALIAALAAGGLAAAAAAVIMAAAKPTAPKAPEAPSAPVAPPTVVAPTPAPVEPTPAPTPPVEAPTAAEPATAPRGQRTLPSHKKKPAEKAPTPQTAPPAPKTPPSAPQGSAARPADDDEGTINPFRKKPPP